MSKDKFEWGQPCPAGCCTQTMDEVLAEVNENVGAYNPYVMKSGEEITAEINSWAVPSCEVCNDRGRVLFSRIDDVCPVCGATFVDVRYDATNRHLAECAIKFAAALNNIK